MARRTSAKAGRLRFARARASGPLDLFPDRHAPLALADICTGCGCVAIAVAHERPDARVLATDISSDALAVALRNAAKHSVASRVSFRQTNLLDAVDGKPVHVLFSLICPTVRRHLQSNSTI